MEQLYTEWLEFARDDFESLARQIAQRTGIAIPAAQLSGE